MFTFASHTLLLKDEKRMNSTPVCLLLIMNLTQKLIAGLVLSSRARLALTQSSSAYQPRYEIHDSDSLMPLDNDDDSWDDIDDNIDSESARLCGLPPGPGEENLYESGAGGESSMIAQARSVVRRYVNLRCPNLAQLTI